MHVQVRRVLRRASEQLRVRVFAPAAIICAAAFAASGCGTGVSEKYPGEKGDRTQQAARFLPPVERSKRRSVRVPVLTYHRVKRYTALGQSALPDLVVEPERFEATIALLKRKGFTSLTSRQLYDALFAGKPLPPKPILITVDDGYHEAVTHVLPVLRRHGMVAGFYVITGRLGDEGYLREEDLRSLEAAGMDVAGHTVSHGDLTTLADSELRREVSSSRRKLGRILDHPVFFFAYPFGRYDERVVKAVRRAGYSVAFTTKSGTHLSSTRALTLPRLHVGREMGPEQVVAAAEGGQ